MYLSIISNNYFCNAIEALQNCHQSKYSYFTKNPKMTDDGNPKDFDKFFKAALGEEKFLTIDKVEDDGKSIYGNFYAGQWASF
ncbi:hypothetical protein [Membranihabitans marinus]|uniref:hypothetical protein n=1 Tax=Membranihabitans marinus TaxID=1227546 RepID=UPI001F24BE6E|nr:hypothetical protein [Membranihabitans marinus]